MKLKDIKPEKIKTRKCPKCGAQMYETGTSWSCSRCNYYEAKEMCSHKYSRGINFVTGKFFSFCLKCGKRWYDDGKRWEEQKKEVIR